MRHRRISLRLRKIKAMRKMPALQVRHLVAKNKLVPRLRSGLKQIFRCIFANLLREYPALSSRPIYYAKKCRIAMNALICSAGFQARASTIPPKLALRAARRRSAALRCVTTAFTATALSKVEGVSAARTA